MKIFVSYSHKDECHRNSLETHTAILRKNKTISMWHDRKISPGEDWESEIDENLNDSDIIILLISSDFIDSEYCFDIELKRALEMHNSEEAIVIPIIVRRCHWDVPELRSIQSLPENLKPITSWDDKDEAWSNVVEGLKMIISKKKKMVRKKKEITRSLKNMNEQFEKITDQIKNKINDTEIELVNKRVRKVCLEDIFVWPDLKDLNEEIDRYAKAISSEEIIDSGKYSLIYGEEQSGKTTLSKRYFHEFVLKGMAPIILDGAKIKSSEISDLITKELSNQYKSPEYYRDNEHKILIIDDFHNCNLNNKYTNKLLDNIKASFYKVVVLSIDLYHYKSVEIDSFEGFMLYEIMNLGHVKRAEIIVKWVSLGVVESIDQASLYKEVDDSKSKVDALTRGGILPAKPIFILTILQMLETMVSHNINLTSYGHCYQYLIYKALDKSRVRTSEVDTYINFLTELGYAIYKNNGDSLDEKNWEKFVDRYGQKYLSVDSEKILDTLISSSILIKVRKSVSFKYSYIYYFFAAKYLSEELSNSVEIRNAIHELLSSLHREENANIIIFITHHSKDDWVLDEIQLSLMEVFQEYEPAKLEKDSLEFLTGFLKNIPELVLEHRRIEDERRDRNERLDKRSDEYRLRKNAQNKESGNLEIDAPDLFYKINTTFKGIEIIGQIIRNRHGSLSREKLVELADQAYGVGLRFLEYFLNISDLAKEEVVHVIQRALDENPSITNQELENEAQSIFLMLTYGAIFGVLRKISMAIGSREAEQVYKIIEESSPTPAIKLINQSIYMQFSKKMDIEKIKRLNGMLMKNPTCSRILREVVIQHIYMFPVEYSDKQKIAEILRIPVAAQLRIGMREQFRK